MRRNALEMGMRITSTSLVGLISIKTLHYYFMNTVTFLFRVSRTALKMTRTRPTCRTCLTRGSPLARRPPTRATTQATWTTQCPSTPSRRRARSNPVTPSTRMTTSLTTSRRSLTLYSAHRITRPGPCTKTRSTTNAPSPTASERPRKAKTTRATKQRTR